MPKPSIMRIFLICPRLDEGLFVELSAVRVQAQQRRLTSRLRSTMWSGMTLGVGHAAIGITLSAW